jgi:tetratricopeptide (TPR) repeat protein
MIKKRNLKEEFFYVLLFLLFCFSPLSAQINIEKQYKTADSLFKAEFYFDAITEYKRLLFFDSLKQYEFESSFNIALCYKMGAKYDESIQYFTKSVPFARTQEEKYNTQIQIVRTNILRRTTGRALELLNMLESDPLNKAKTGEISYWRGWAFLFDGDFEKATIQFNLAENGEELKKICQRADSEKYSVTFAKVISYILPGAGEFYTGEILSGVISLGWNVLFSYMTVTSFIEKRVFDGVLIGDLLFLRFYRGNIQSAEKFAIKKNLEITNKTLLFIQYNYQGIKP